jgi:hypothetical protein
MSCDANTYAAVDEFCRAEKGGPGPGRGRCRSAAAPNDSDRGGAPAGGGGNLWGGGATDQAAAMPGADAAGREPRRRAPNKSPAPAKPPSPSPPIPTSRSESSLTANQLHRQHHCGLRGGCCMGAARTKVLLARPPDRPTARPSPAHSGHPRTPRSPHRAAGDSAGGLSGGHDRGSGRRSLPAFSAHKNIRQS